ncbi:hypothetical protein EDD85DRAFT_870225, partial [Armillaria nabsnona]
HLQQYITAHQAVVSPIRRFPTEILAEIFIQSLEDHYDVFDTKRGPWGLCYVCRRWRDVLRPSPALWASLSIESLHLQPQLRHADAILEDVLAFTSNRKFNIRYSLKSVIICDRSLPDSYLPKTIWSNRGSNSWDILQLLFEILIFTVEDCLASHSIQIMFHTTDGQGKTDFTGLYRFLRGS